MYTCNFFKVVKAKTNVSTSHSTNVLNASVLVQRSTESTCISIYILILTDRPDTQTDYHTPSAHVHQGINTICYCLVKAGPCYVCSFFQKRSKNRNISASCTLVSCNCSTRLLISSVLTMYSNALINQCCLLRALKSFLYLSALPFLSSPFLLVRFSSLLKIAGNF